MRRAVTRTAIRALALPFSLSAAACAPQQSAFAPIGAEAGRVEVLFWVMTATGAAIFLAVVALTAAAMFGSARTRAGISADRFVIGAGVVFPIVVLSGLLGYGLLLMRAAEAPADADGLRIAVSGELWWWRVTYTDTAGRVVESANELHVPTGRPVTLALTSADVIHSFWAPRLAGKLDMIPGRTNRLTVIAEKEGVSRGQCAEYCGGAHALMAFHLVAQTPEDFAAWFEREAAPATAPATETARRGRDIFLDSGCGACHTVRGTAARGTIGPDLTHVGGRMSLAAATLPNDAEAFARWITDNQHIKPENRMPPYAIFRPGELDELAAYLEGLR